MPMQRCEGCGSKVWVKTAGLRVTSCSLCERQREAREAEQRRKAEAEQEERLTRASEAASRAEAAVRSFERDHLVLPLWCGLCGLVGQIYGPVALIDVLTVEARCPRCGKAISATRAKLQQPVSRPPARRRSDARHLHLIAGKRDEPRGE